MAHSLQISYIRIITLTNFLSGVQHSKNSVKNGINTRTKFTWNYVYVKPATCNERYRFK